MQRVDLLGKRQLAVRVTPLRCQVAKLRCQVVTYLASTVLMATLLRGSAARCCCR